MSRFMYKVVRAASYASALTSAVLFALILGKQEGAYTLSSVTLGFEDAYADVPVGDDSSGDGGSSGDATQGGEDSSGGGGSDGK